MIILDYTPSGVTVSDAGMVFELRRSSFSPREWEDLLHQRDRIPLDSATATHSVWPACSLPS